MSVIRRRRRLHVVSCGNDDTDPSPPKLAALQYVQCPRCAAMAEAPLADGDMLVIDCRKCGLLGSTGQITIWDAKYSRQVETRIALDLQRAVDVVVIGNTPAEIWQGDVCIASYLPSVGLHFYAGYCAVEED